MATPSSLLKKTRRIEQNRMETKKGTQQRMKTECDWNENTLASVTGRLFLFVC